MAGVKDDEQGLALPLTVQDRRTPLMMKMIEYIDERIAQHRRKNDCDLNPELTAHYRGRIAELKHLKDLLAAGEGRD